jgi:hypothetical protein
MCCKSVKRITVVITEHPNKSRSNPESTIIYCRGDPNTGHFGVKKWLRPYTRHIIIIIKNLIIIIIITFIIIRNIFYT